jgi:hypothetical protein
MLTLNVDGIPNAVTFTPDGSALVVGLQHGLRVWRVPSLAEIDGRK